MINKIILILFFLYILVNCYSLKKENFSNPKDICRGYLTDLEYLEHMIPHHQVAIDISIQLQKISKSPVMQEILRKLVFNQRMEIILMKSMMNKLPRNVSDKISKGYLPNRADYIKPNVIGLSRTYCDPHFFDPKGHMKHMEHMKLNDKVYIEHMIPHHQVAVDISKMLQKLSTSPVMQDILRKLIWTQETEIIMMKIMMKNLPKKVSSKAKMKRDYITTLGDYVKPNKIGLTNTYCDPHFFDPKEHMKHLKHMKLNDKMYIQHMIPHHQVAVDMSKVLLKNTKNDFMIYLAYRIIRSQQGEIIMLDNLLNKSTYKHHSDLIN